MNLRAIRQLKKIDVDEAASALGIKTSLLYSYESGRVNPKIEFLQNAATYYGVTLEEITASKELKAKKLLESGSNSIVQSAIDELKYQIQEYREREKHYRETISQLTQQLGKHLGDSGAVVATNRAFWLQSGLHKLRKAS